MALFSLDGVTLRQLRRDPEIYLVRIPSDAVSGFTNCYVVREGGQALVIDMGPDSRRNRRIWRQVAETLQLDRTRLRIFLTHLHNDHAGVVPHLDLAGVPVLVPRANQRDYDYRNDPENYARYRRRWEQEAFLPIDRRFLRFVGPAYYVWLPPRLDVRMVDSGDVVDVGGFALRGVDTSGHVPGHLSLFNERDRILFDGDHLLFVTTPVIEPCAYHLDVPGTYVANLRKVQALGAAMHLHAHGRVGADLDYARRAERIAGHVEARVERAYDVVACAPGITGYGIISRLGWRLGGISWEEHDTGFRECILEAGMATVDALRARGLVRREPDEAGCWRYHAC